MTLDDAALVAGPLGALVVAPAALAVLASRRRPAWASWVGAAQLLVVAVSWLAYWVNWGRAFEYADSLQAVPASLEERLPRLAAATAVSTVALALTAGVSLASKRARGAERPHRF